MIEKIVERIEAYSLSQSKPVTAIEFGAAELPAPPYVVVKQGRDPSGLEFLIIGHFKPGQQSALRAFMRTTIGQALDGFSATSDSGQYNELKSDFDATPGPIVNTNDDNTISLERSYYMGDRMQ